MLKVDKQTIKDFSIAVLMWTSFTMIYLLIAN